jgi:serine/threonine-protein kinase
MELDVPPELAARFDIQEELGRGAFGAVYRIRDRESRQTWALKLISVGEDRRRIERELAIAREVEHPHVLACPDAGIVGDVAYLVLELAAGSLSDLLVGPEYRARAWKALREAARGVAALHEKGLVHRDLKPDNVMLVQGEARVGDLGLARGGAHEKVTSTGVILGSPLYMSPEQARGEELGPASDVYSLGVIAYQIVEGATPYPDVSLGELMVRVSQAQVDPLQRSLSWLPSAARSGILRALEFEPWKRPQDAAAWADELGEFAGPGEGEAKAVPADLATTRGGAASDTREVVAREEMTGERTGEVVPPVAPVAPPARLAPPESSSEASSSVRPEAIAGGVVGVVLAVGLVIRSLAPDPELQAREYIMMGHKVDVVFLGKPSRMVTLESEDPELDDNDMLQVARLRALERLALHTPGVTDNGIEFLYELPRLRELDVSGSGVTRHGLGSFRGHPTLERVIVGGQWFSQEVLEGLQEDLGSIEVERKPWPRATPRRHSRSRPGGPAEGAEAGY